MPKSKTDQTLDKALSLLQDKDAEEIRKLSQSLRDLSSYEAKKQKCESARDRLLEAQTNLHSVFAVYQIPFKAIDQSSQEWDNFNNVVRTSEADRSLRSLLAVGEIWGADVVKHYAFLSKGRKYCDLLRTAAYKVPNWKLAAKSLSFWIFRRKNGGGRQPSVKNVINPIEQSDLTKLQSPASDMDDADFAKFYGFLIKSGGFTTSNGFGLDKYGLLVHEHFAAKAPNLMALQTEPTSPLAALSNSHVRTSNCTGNGQSAVQSSPSGPSGELPSPDSFSDTSSLITPSPPSQSSSSYCQQDSQPSQSENTTLQSPSPISRPPTDEISEDYVVQRKFAVSPLSLAFHDSSELINPGNNDQVEYSIPTPTDPRSASQLSSQASDIARDRNVTPTPSGQGPPSPSSRITTTLEAIDFATESLSSLRHTFAPGLTANETSPQLTSSLVEISQTQSISVPAVSPTPLSSSSISHRLPPSSPLTKSCNSEPSLSPPGDFSHEAKSNMVEPPEVAYSEDDSAINEELSQTATVAFSSPIEVTNNPARSPSTDPNPALSPPSLSPRSSFHHEATQTLTVTSNCRVNGAVNRTMPPCLLTKPENLKSSSELVRKRPGSNSRESSPKKQKGNDGDPTTALITPLRPLSAAASGSHRLDSHATINSTESTEWTPSSPTLTANPWLKDAMLSLDRLDQNKWLNDAIINAYIHILARRYEFCLLNSHLLQSRSPDRKAEYGDPLESDLVLMPIYECFHWYLLVMYKFSGTGYTVCFLDSLQSPSRSYEHIFTLWTQYLKDIGCREAVHRRKVTVPQQSNNADCGVFLLAFAYKIVEDRQKFFDAIENGAGVDWTIDALKWRGLIRFELKSVNDNRPAITAETIHLESGSDACIEVASACHALRSSSGVLPTLASYVNRDPQAGQTICPTKFPRQDLLPGCTAPQRRSVLSESGHSTLKGSLPPWPPLVGNQAEERLPGLMQLNILDPTHGQASERSIVDMNYTRADTKDGNNTTSRGFGVDAHNPDNSLTTVLSTDLAEPAPEEEINVQEDTCFGSGVDASTVPLIGSTSIQVEPSIRDSVAPIFQDQNFWTGPQTKTDTSEPLLTQSETDVQELQENGFVHWKAHYVGLGVQHILETDIWTINGLEILRLVLANPRLQTILRKWFGREPYMIGHCMWWSANATGCQPIYLMRDVPDAKYLGLHLLPGTAGVSYFARSHINIWPGTKGLWFSNSHVALQEFRKSEIVSDGITVFNPMTNHQFDHGRGITIIFVTPCAASAWAPLEKMNPSHEEVLRKMKQDGIDWNRGISG